MTSHDKKVLTVQDISCVGQCSLTVALPIISACGIETAILPSAVLSTHTGGFQGFTFRDLTEDIPDIVAHWEKEKITFDAIYTGYLGSKRQIDLVKEMFRRVATPDCLKVVDPAMADHGKLYYGFDMDFAHEMSTLCGEADVVLPNITEAAMMTGLPYKDKGYDETYIKALMDGILALGAKTVVLTGVCYDEAQLGIAVLSAGEQKISYYFHEKMEKSCHGTGDIYSSAFVGAMVRGRTPLEAARIAGDFTLAGMKATVGDEGHWYGTKFEKALPLLIHELNR
ncbi:MAG: pyridoxamine kinase [Clostridia bacterium]|nr:pyridoxamine kinase [Clostridia bacterium]MBR7111919.1 pyridoxamine kinase [Clostridia bacterium]